MEQEIAKKETNELANYNADLLKEMNESFGAATDVTAEDIQFPIVSLQHPMSKKVLEGVAKPGSIYHYSLEKEVGDKNTSFFFIPIKFYKFFRVEDAKGVMKTQRPWKLGDVIDFSRADGYREVEMHVHYFVTKDDTGSSMPCRFSFKRSSLPASRYISTQLNILKSEGIKPWDYFWKMTTKLTTKKDNTYYEPVILIDNKDKVPLDLQVHAFKWYKTMSATSYNEKVEKDIMTNEEEAVLEEQHPFVDKSDDIYRGF